MLRCTAWFVVFWVCSRKCCADLGEDVPPQRGEDHEADAPGRSLSFIYPNDVKIQVGGGASYSFGQTAAPLYAGVDNNPVVIDVRPSSLLNPFRPRFRLTPKNGSCALGDLPPGRVAEPYASGDVTVTLQDSDHIGRSDSTFTFHMGGEFQVCYSEDGTFDLKNGDVIDVIYPVYGVYDNCSTADCLANQKYNCFFLKNSPNPAGSCVLSYNRTGQGFYGPVGAGTWTPAFSATYDANGASQSVTAQACGQASASADSQYIGTDGVDRFIAPTASSGYKEIPIPQTHGTLSGASFSPFTVAACYCPSYSGCDGNADFAQQIGVIHYFMSKICATSGCTTDYAGVATKHTFIVRVECPPGGCSATATSRMKLVSTSAANDLPSWDPANGCRTAVHSSIFWPFGNCASATSCSFDGGSRQDYKAFSGLSVLAEEPGVAYGAERYDLRHKGTGQDLDICFCDSACDNASSWFKVGQFRSSPFQLVGHSNLGQADDVRAIEYIASSGMLGLARPVADADSVGLTTGGILKLLSDNDLAVNDSECGTKAYDSSLVSAPATESAALFYQGAAATNRLVFNGGTASRHIAVQRAGVVAICYCHVTSSTGCSDQQHWKLAGRLTVRGPTLGQSWEFSVSVISRLEYFGWGLESDNVLRIIHKHSSCSDNSGNPHSQDPIVLLGCPDNCQEPVNSPGLETHIATQITAYNTSGCDRQHSNCSTVYLTGIDTATLASASDISSSKTLLSFSADPGLSDGDILALGEEIVGGSAEQNAAMRGVFPFQDAGTYLVGHKVTRHAASGANNYEVQLGWLSSSAPSFSFSGGSGTWKRHSRGTTREEVVAMAETRDMKVCWAPSAGSAFIAQIGTVSFVDPPAMPSAGVDPASIAVDVSMPVIVSFETGDRARYTSSQGAMRLRLLVTSTDYFQLDFANGTAVPAGNAVAPEAARRGVCGQLLAELWSSDGRGFPYPQGCYYGPERRYRGVGTRELVVVFEPRAGLAPGVRYQMVLQATLRRGIRAGDELLHIFSLDATAEQPYLALELGRGRLGRTPAAAAATAPGPRLTALELLGGADGLATINDTAAPLQVKLSGDSLRPVIAGSRLRIVFRPLTLWNLGPVCVVTCTPSSGHTCGRITQCHGEAIVAQSGNKNMASLVLPADLTAISGSVLPVLSFWALHQPEQGFFPTKIGAQLTRSDGLSPQYIESGGAYLYHARTGAGTAVASVVTSDGNSKPFRGDAGNELYVRIAFATTLFARTVGTSLFTVTLPTGYTCVSASAAAPSLNIFDFESKPQRRGALASAPAGAASDGTWTFSGNICRYSLLEDGVIYAGSVVYIRLSVDNPATPLLRSNAASDWALDLQSPGENGSATAVAMPRVTFARPAGSAPISALLASGAAVLGRLTEASAQPSDFTVGATQLLRIFFRAEQATGLRAQLLVDAPLGFDFGSPCVARDLSGAAVAYGAGPTLRLPGIESCQGKATKGDVSLRDRAVIQVRGELAAGTRYGLEVSVRNSAASAFAGAALTSWRLTVRAEAGFTIDSMPGTLPLTLADVNSSWGIYQKRLQWPTHVSIAVSSYLPYSISQAYATVTIFPLKVPSDVTSGLRILAPHGYQWVVNSSTAQYLNETVADGVPGATADLPAGLPQLAASAAALEWSEASWDARETYGFICEIRVPDGIPSMAVNSFIVELGGWTSGDITDRHAAGTVNAGEVQALRDGLVSPTSSVAGQAATVTIQVRTVTEIPQGGGLLVTSPANFSFSSQCSVQAAAGSAPLPVGLACSAQEVGNASEVSLTTSGARMPAGLYSFQLTTTNPTSAVSSAASGSTACGYEQCWTVVALQSMTNRALFTDLQVSIPGYAVFARMPQALLAPLTRAQSLALRRDDRPGKPSDLVFAINLASTPSAASEMILVGPVGTTFRTNCLSGVVTDSALVFGSSANFDSSTYTAWPSGATVTGCVGRDNRARLLVAVGLQANKTYAWRMELLSTPPQQPTDNVWTVEFAGEASAPFASFALRTFADASLAPASSAARPEADLLRVNAEPSSAPVTVSFRPYSSVVEGLLRLHAPPSFRFGGSDSRCTAELQRLPVGGSTQIFSAQSFVCRVDSRTPWVILLELAPGTSLEAGVLHRLVLLVENPRQELPAKAWTLQSFSRGSTSFESALDEVLLPGYPVVQAASLWSVKLVVPASGEPQNRGLQRVSLRLVASTPSVLSANDVLEIFGPGGFTFAGTGGSCDGFAWLTDIPAAGGTLVGSLSGVTASCSQAGTIRVTYAGAAQIAAGVRLAISVGTTNPRVTPSWSENLWRFKHRRASQILAAGLQRGYSVVPQLEALEVNLTGQTQAAMSTSTLNITFRAVRNCTHVRITADQPSGFDFTNAVLQSASVAQVGQPGLGVPIPARIVTAVAVANTAVVARRRLRRLQAAGSSTAIGSSTIHIEASVGAEQAVLFVLSGVKLGRTGGQTQWTVQTFAGGVSMDKGSGLGFRLPGLITTVYQALSNELDPQLSPLARTSSEAAILSQWKPRVRSPAVAEFTLRFSNAVEALEELEVSSDAGFSMRASDLQLFSVNTLGQRVPVNVTLMSANPPVPGNNSVRSEPAEAISVRVLEVLRAEVDHVLVLPLQTSAQLGWPGLWRFQTRRVGEPLPTHTNDAQTPGFQLAEVVRLQTSAAHAPPAATFPVSINMTLGSSSATALHLVLPDSYSAPTSCAVSSDVECTSFPSGSRRQLTLRPLGGRAFGGNESLQVLVTSPWSEPNSTAWLLEAVVDGSQASGAVALPNDVASSTVGQVGWGEDRQGIALTPLRNIAVRYGAVPVATVALLLSFDVLPRGRAVRNVRVFPPTNYKLTCDSRFLRFISSVQNQTTCLEDPLMFSIGKPFPLGRHSILLGARVPERDPPLGDAYGRAFKVLLLDSSDAVVDSNMLVPAQSIASPLLRTEQPTLAWTVSHALSQPSVTLKLRFLRALPVGSNPLAMAAILLEMPEGFENVILVPSDVVNLNSNFPLLGTDWAEYDGKTRSSYFTGNSQTKNFRLVRILRDETRRVPAGIYRWSYPVKVPLHLPASNVWRVSLCATRSCSAPDSAETPVTFLIRGFRHGEQSVEKAHDPALVSAAVGGHRFTTAAALLLACHCFLVFLTPHWH